MKPEIKLFFDFEFTSLSPDAQPISLGIVSQDMLTKQIMGDFLCGNNNPCLSKSFYAEFSDFDINRCDDWVKENVLSKLILNKSELPKEKTSAQKIDLIDGSKYVLYQKKWEKGDHETLVQFDSPPMVFGNTIGIKQCLKQWLLQFSDYNIQFVCDCGTWDWYWMLQLLAEWEEYPCKWKFPDSSDMKNCTTELGEKSIDEFRAWYHEKDKYWMKDKTHVRFCDLIPIKYIKTGLPKLPENISPVPEDLNDLIAIKKGISVREAFELNREELAGAWPESVIEFKHSSLWDAKVIKAIYEKMK